MCWIHIKIQWYETAFFSTVAHTESDWLHLLVYEMNHAFKRKKNTDTFDGNTWDWYTFVFILYVQLKNESAELKSLQTPKTSLQTVIVMTEETLPAPAAAQMSEKTDGTWTNTCK